MDYRFENENMDNMQHDEGNVTGEGQHCTQTPLEPQPPKKGNTGARITALVLSCARVGGAMGFGGSALQNHLAAKDKDKDAESPQASDENKGSSERRCLPGRWQKWPWRAISWAPRHCCFWTT